MVQLDPVFCTALAIIAAAFAPSLIYLIWIRNKEKFDREPILTLLGTFIYCAIIAVVLSYIFETILVSAYIGFQPSTTGAIVTTVAIAPIVEEAVKPLGVYRLRNSKAFNEPDDGAVYGAAAGLGFAATENLMYGVRSLAMYGLEVYIITVVFRAVSSTLIHASATGFTGYGIGKWKFGTPSIVIPASYLLAVLIHATFNFFAFKEEVLISLALAVVSIIALRRVIK